LGVAVSGGPDSMALLLLAAAALPGKVEAATVDHGLRPDSADEARMVADVCGALGIPHAILTVTLARGNLQSEARAARYAAFTGWLGDRSLSALATAHHADDQAETLLMRLNRASGVAGLAGVRARGVVPESGIPLIRPVLDWRRHELAAIAEVAGIDPVQDPSNSADRFDRVRLRKALVEADWLDIPALSASAANLADADAALDWAATRELAEAVIWDGETALYRPGAPRAIALRVIARIIVQLGNNHPRGGGVARMHDALVAGRAATLAGVAARTVRQGWHFRPAPARRG
jgi:tRNA(Ile)-lysidine synthase